MIKNITIKDYFNLSNILKNTTKKEFQHYQKDINYIYNKDNKLQELYTFYKTQKDKYNLKNDIFEQLIGIKKVLLVVVFLISFVVTYNYFDKEINIKTYLLFSVALPLIYSLFAIINILRYKYPQKDESSLLNTFFKKISSTFENKHNHIFKTYSIVMFIEMGISYGIGILIASIIIFWSHNVTFYSESSYISNTSIEKTDIKKDDARVIVSKSYWSKLITLAIFFVIVFKFILRYFTLKVLDKTIVNSLEEQAKEFFDVMSTNTVISIDTNHKQTKTINSQQHSKKTDDILSHKFYKLYYEMELVDAKNIEFYDKELCDNSFQEYSFALFDKENEDEKVLSFLEGFVLVFASPESLADETFRSYIQQMLSKNNIIEILILPLVQKDDVYTLLNKNDDKYFDWKDKVENIINDDRVSLYYEK